MINHELFTRLLQENAKGNVMMSGDTSNYVLFKYHPECHIEGRWNEWNKKARGIIFYAPTATIVCRPFDKFFNLDEVDETRLENLPLNEPMILWEKVDGSCCSAFNYYNQVKCATPGSFSSPQSEWGTKWLADHLTKIGLYDDFLSAIGEVTPIFECIWPASEGNPAPGVVNYGERRGLVLLAVRYLNGEEFTLTKTNEFAKKYCFEQPRKFDGTLNRELASKIESNQEGYVAHFIKSNFRVKIKSSEYMALHKMRDKVNMKGVIEILRAGESRRWLTILPKHLSMIADDLIAEVQQNFFKIKFMVEEVFEQANVLNTRKEQALHIQKCLPQKYQGLCFNKLSNKFDEKDIYGVLLKEIGNVKVQD